MNSGGAKRKHQREKEAGKRRNGDERPKVLGQYERFGQNKGWGRCFGKGK
jgi:hypothetical protein